MLSKSILAAATCLLSYSAASPTPVQRRDCPTYAVYSALADIASQGVPSATVTALAYPASGIVNNSEYPTSWGIGIDHLQGLIKYYVDTCATTKVVLLVVGGVVFADPSFVAGLEPLDYTGTSSSGAASNTDTNGAILSIFVGGVVFADPSFVAGLEPLDYTGTSSSGAASNTDTNGAIQDPNPNLQSMVNQGKGAVFRSYCQAGDIYCANGGSGGVTIHEQEEGIWLVNRLETEDGLSSMTYCVGQWPIYNLGVNFHDVIEVYCNSRNPSRMASGQRDAPLISPPLQFTTNAHVIRRC
nr:hypothetical protein CFP56_11694 [Quercus suber]